MEMKFNPAETMSPYINRVLEAGKNLEQVGKVVSIDEVAYQITEHLPSSYENLIIQLYQLADANFTVNRIRPFLLAKCDR